MAEPIKKSKSGSFFKSPVDVDWDEVRRAYILLWDTKLDEAEEIVKHKKENNIWYMFVYCEVWANVCFID